MVANFFDRIKGPARQVEEKTKQPRWDSTLDSPQADRLLDWILTRWTAEHITLAQILTYGPGSIRDKPLAMRMIQILVMRGWLVPRKPWRVDQWRWDIVRRPTTAAVGKTARGANLNTA
jgi:hypothetical protein